MAVEARQLAPDLVQLDKPVDRAQQMIGGTCPSTVDLSVSDDGKGSDGDMLRK